MRESAMQGAESSASKPGVSFAGDTTTATTTTTASGGGTLLPEAAQFVGLENKASTCYLNALVQVLFCTPEFREMVYRMPRRSAAPASSAPAASSSPEAQASAVAAPAASSTPVDRKNDVVFQLQALFARLQLATEKLVSTDALTTSFGWSSYVALVVWRVRLCACLRARACAYSVPCAGKRRSCSTMCTSSRPSCSTTSRRRPPVLRPRR